MTIIDFPNHFQADGDGKTYEYIEFGCIQVTWIIWSLHALNTTSHVINHSHVRNLLTCDAPKMLSTLHLVMKVSQP